MLDLAARPSTRSGRPLAGQGAALIFEKPSTRTRQSTEMAVVQLGGHPSTRRGDEIGIDEREPVEDVVRILQGYHAVIAARVFDHDVLRADGRRRHRADRQHAVGPRPPAAGARRRPDDGGGPRVARRPHRGVGRRLQQRRPLAGRGLRACSAPHVRFACPLGYDADDAELERLALLGAASVTQTHRPADAVAGADAVHADTWVSMGQEDDKAARKQAFEGFTVDAR